MADQADTETGRLYAHRRREARKAGLTRVEAERFAAGDQPVALLRRLVKDGCPPATIARIVR